MIPLPTQVAYNWFGNTALSVIPTNEGAAGWGEAAAESLLCPTATGGRTVGGKVGRS
jgi:hypothetical protein